MRLTCIFLLSIGATASLGCAASANAGVADDAGSSSSNASNGGNGNGNTGGSGTGTGGSTGSGSSDGGTSSTGSGSSASDAGAGKHSDGGKGTSDSGSGTTTSPDGSVSVSGTSPNIGGCAVFPADNAWNTRIDDPVAYPVHPNAATYSASMAPTKTVHPDWGDWNPDQDGIPWQVAPSTQAEVAIAFPQGSDQSDLGPYPLPSTALVEGGGDGHVLVLQTGTCMLYELYQGVFTNPGWSCTSAAKFDLSSNALRPDGWTSTDAAGLPILPGLVKLAEVQAGAIKHAMRFSVGSTQQGYIHPATHAAGKADTTLPPMGLRVRLKASFDTSSFTGPTLVIMTAMKQYGLILADNGSDWYVTGDSDDGWASLMDDISSGMKAITGADFEAVVTGDISTAGL